MSTDRGKDKDVGHISMEHYSAIKKSELGPSAATWMGLEIVILSEACQKMTNMISLTCGVLKKGTSDLHKTEVQSQI